MAACPLMWQYAIQAEVSALCLLVILVMLVMFVIV